LSTLAYGFLAESFNLSLITIIGTTLSFFAILPVFLDKGITKMITSEN
jgi:hypothetical protein